MAVTGAAYKTQFPDCPSLASSDRFFFSYGFLTYLAVALALALAFFLAKTRTWTEPEGCGRESGHGRCGRHQCNGLQVPGHLPGREASAAWADYTLSWNTRRYLDQQRIRRQRLACNRPGYLRTVETGQCHLGFYPVWRSVHPLPVYTGLDRGAQEIFKALPMWSPLWSWL